MDTEQKKKAAETKLFMAQQTEGNNAFAASMLYADALSIYQELNDSEKINLCLKKIRENNVEAQKSFHKAEATEFISHEVIESVLEPIRTAESIEKALSYFAHHPALGVNYSSVISEIENSPFIARKIFSSSTISQKGDFVKGGSNGDYSEIMFHYQIHHKIICALYLQPIWEILLDKGLTVDRLVDFFQRRLRLDNDQLGLLRKGFNYVFDKDSVGAIHVLIPRFENTILTLASGLGIKTISLERNKKGVKEVAMRNVMVTKEFLKDSQVQEKFGVDFCEYASFFLCEPLGPNLRNRVAHGDVQLKDFSFQDTLFLVRLLLFFPTSFSFQDGTDQ